VKKLNTEKSTAVVNTIYTSELRPIFGAGAAGVAGAVFRDTR